MINCPALIDASNKTTMSLEQKSTWKDFCKDASFKAVDRMGTSTYLFLLMMNRFFLYLVIKIHLGLWHGWWSSRDDTYPRLVLP